MRRLNRRRWIVMLRSVLMCLALLSLVGLAGPAQAHAMLVRSDPPDNAVLPKAPAAVHLWFGEPVTPELSSLRLLDQDGNAYPNLSVRADPADPRALTADLPGLGDGLYSLAWQVLSSKDGHTSQGVLVFRVGQDDGKGMVGQHGADHAELPAWYAVIARTLNFLGLCGVTGALLLLLVRGDEASMLPAARDRLLRWAFITAGLAGLAGFGALVLQVLMATAAAAARLGDTLWVVLTQTSWGMFWLAQMVLVLTVFLVLALWRKKIRAYAARVGLLVCLGLAASALLTLSLSSHAGAEAQPGMPVILDWVHLLAASVWIGGLGALLVAYPPWKPSPAARQTWSSFGIYAAVAVAVLFLTGSLATLRLVALPAGLFGSLYGNTLLLKVSLVVVVGLFGMLNHMTLHPQGRLARWAALVWGGFAANMGVPRWIAAEAAVGVMVLVLAAALTEQAPANGPQFRYSGLTQPNPASQQVGDMIITLIVRPNHPGQNIVLVQAVSTLRPPPAPITRVLVRATYLGQDLGTHSEEAQPVRADQYQFRSNHFSLPGPWKIEVVVRRNGLPDQVGIFQWNVLPAP